MSLPLMSPDVVAALIGGLFGLIVGSFANVVIYRLPLEQSIVFPASRCPGCHTQIAPWHNIPVLSWFLLGGRCASCQTPISFRYPAVEALHGVGFAAILLNFGLTPFTPALLLFYFALVVLAFIDWDHQILPDRITLPSVAIGLATTFLPGSLISWRESLFAAALGYLGFFVVAEGYSRLRGIEGLGMGDWKLAAMVGSFMGGRRLLLVVFLGSLSGMVYGLAQAFKERRAIAHNDPPVPEPACAEPSRSVEGPAGEGAPVPVPEPVEGPANVGAPLVVPELIDGAGRRVVPELVEGVGRRVGALSPTVDLSPAADLSPDDGPPPIGLYKLPFGTFLAAAAVFVLFFGDFVLSWYAGFFPF